MRQDGAEDKIWENDHYVGPGHGGGTHKGA